MMSRTAGYSMGLRVVRRHECASLVSDPSGGRVSTCIFLRPVEACCAGDGRRLQAARPSRLPQGRDHETGY